MILRIKKILRSCGYDIRYYHSLYDTVLKHHDIKTILDIGANDGHWSQEMRTLFPTAHIYAFEPLKDCFERITNQFSSDPHYKAFNIALGNTDGTTEIERSSFHPSSSLLRMAQLHKDLYPKSAEIVRENIEVRRLDSMASELSLTPDVLIKMDVQGFEDKVISGGRTVLAKVKVIIIETSFVTLYENQPLFGDIHNTLNQLGFTYRGNCGEHYSRLTGERIYEDSVFIQKG
jgi:FkbM family methyltransferase